MPQVFDTFYKSILKLYCFVLKFKSKREEALSNFKRSTPGGYPQATKRDHVGLHPG